MLYIYMTMVRTGFAGSSRGPRKGEGQVEELESAYDGCEQGIGHDIAQLGQYNVEKGLELISPVHLGCLHNIIGYTLDSRGK